MKKYKFFTNGHLSLDATSGIYAIVNVLNNKKYVGSSANIRKRYRQHINALIKNKHVNRHLQNAFNLYGNETFEFWILEECENIQSTLMSIEQKYIDSDGEYNICKLATHQCGDVYTGHVISEEHKRIIRESNKNRIWTKESRQKITNFLRNSEYITSLRKKVMQFDLNGVFIKEYNSITSAAVDLGNINKRVSIKRCCQGKNKTAYQYTWKFKDDNKIIEY